MVLTTAAGAHASLIGPSYRSSNNNLNSSGTWCSRSHMCHYLWCTANNHWSSPTKGLDWLYAWNECTLPNDRRSVGMQFSISWETCGAQARCQVETHRACNNSLCDKSCMLKEGNHGSQWWQTPWRYKYLTSVLIDNYLMWLSSSQHWTLQQIFVVITIMTGLIQPNIFQAQLHHRWNRHWKEEMIKISPNGSTCWGCFPTHYLEKNCPLQ